jgi:hypothetical protein
MNKLPKRPIDVKDVVWSHIGKDELDAAAELVWNETRNVGHVWATNDGSRQPYHVQSSSAQHAAQRAVLAVLGTTVPKMLRERAKSEQSDGASVDDVYYLIDLADDLEDEHGI